MAPNLTLDSLSIASNSKRSRSPIRFPTDTSTPIVDREPDYSYEIAELDAELAQLQERNKKLNKKFDNVVEIVAQKYPDGAIARVFLADAKARFDNKVQLTMRQRLGINLLWDKAEQMIDQEREERELTYDDIDRDLKKINAEIDGAKARLEQVSRKRASTESMPENVKKRRTE